MNSIFNPISKISSVEDIWDKEKHEEEEEEEETVGNVEHEQEKEQSRCVKTQRAPSPSYPSGSVEPQSTAMLAGLSVSSPLTPPLLPSFCSGSRPSSEYRSRPQCGA